MPEPARGTHDYLKVWVELRTSRELDASGAVALLDAMIGQKRREKLESLDGLRAP